jgi:hypothetical protein
LLHHALPPWCSASPWAQKQWSQKSIGWAKKTSSALGWFSQVFCHSNRKLTNPHDTLVMMFCGLYHGWFVTLVGAVFWSGGLSQVVAGYRLRWGKRRKCDSELIQGVRYISAVKGSFV